MFRANLRSKSAARAFVIAMDGSRDILGTIGHGDERFLLTVVENTMNTADFSRPSIFTRRHRGAAVFLFAAGWLIGGHVLLAQVAPPRAPATAPSPPEELTIFTE